ncbi:hypothetical protein [Paraburkholderia lycopersici]|uniref:hypothetical protein n=1 Tax=Paraburkholderia lycopersici TaxID=416944 RepID=UPI001160F76E|nr:hypothetical protein [Paraburkholderia lycopersici]
MSVRKKNESTGGSPTASLKSRLQEVQQTLDAVRSHIRHHGFTPEQVFGYQGKADASNLKDEAPGPAPVRPVAKKAAPKKAVAAKRTAPDGAARRTGESRPAAKRATKAAPVAEDARSAAPAPKPALNPAAAWPFPGGSRS